MSTKVATTAAAALAPSILALMANGTCRLLRQMKNNAAALVAVMTGKSRSPELCVNVLTMRNIAMTRAATIARKSTMPGRESRYCLSASIKVSPVVLGVE